MGSFRICEIIEAKDEKITVSRSDRIRGLGGDQKHLLRGTGHKTILDEDFNKLFDTLNLRTSKSVDLPDRSKSASKKPMRPAGSYSPGIGFSDPVSLKQALRGLCVSQAVEMAAIKRSSIPASPRTSETGKISSMYRAVEHSQSPLAGGERKKEISLAPGDASTAPPDSLCSADETVESICSTVAHKEIASISESITPVTELQKGCHWSSSAHSESNDQDYFSKSEVEGEPNKVLSNDLATSTEAAEKTAHKRRRKPRTVVASTAKAKGKKDLHSARNMSRGFRPIVTTKSIVIKKAAKVALSADRHSKTPREVKKGEDHSSGLIICERCQCSLRDTDKDSGKDPSSTISVIKADKPSKKNGKGDMSLSSKSSVDLSSSTTSLSDDSNLSIFHCSNKPHMAKDIRWKAINHVIEKCGSLGLRHFSLLKKLGSGDIGTVYLAELVGTNCHFAIKVMDNEFLARRKKMSRAQTEGEILKMLDHPFLPTLYAQFTSDNLSCLVLEFCPGGDLHVLRQRQPGRHFSEEAARFYVAEVLLALEYLHMLGIVYRDLKPENILVRADGHIMLTDFDLSLRCTVNPTLIKSSSKQLEPPRFSGQCAGSSCIDPFCTGPACKVSCFAPRLPPHSSRARKPRGDPSLLPESLPQLVAEPTGARSNSFVGTHEYLAPEIIKGEGHGSAVDWWTLGILLYELLYGRTPFKGAGNEETLTNVVLQSLRFPDTPIVSFHARDLIRSLLVKEPESRLGAGTGAGEIKRHLFFHGLNWALIRTASPPQVPETVQLEKKEKSFLEYGDNGEKLEFELF